MEPIKFTPLEAEVLITFFFFFINKETLPHGAMSRFLLLAFIKLLKAKKEWDEAMAYTE